MSTFNHQATTLFTKTRERLDETIFNGYLELTNLLRRTDSYSNPMNEEQRVILEKLMKYIDRNSDNPAKCILDIKIIFHGEFASHFLSSLTEDAQQEFNEIVGMVEKLLATFKNL